MNMLSVPPGGQTTDRLVIALHKGQYHGNDLILHFDQAWECARAEPVFDHEDGCRFLDQLLYFPAGFVNQPEQLTAVPIGIAGLH